MWSVASLGAFTTTLAGITFSYRTMNAGRLHRWLVSRQDRLEVAHPEPTPENALPGQVGPDTHMDGFPTYRELEIGT